MSQRASLDVNRRGALATLAAGAALPGLSAPAAPATSAADLVRDFEAPPPAASPGIYWYWLGGAVTREGITADLEAMAANGIGWVVFFAIGKSSTPPVLSPPADALTPYWWELVRHAVAEAKRVGVRMAMNICDGWATASGPWITPELSMQHLVWTETVVEAGRPPPSIAEPKGKLGYYRDVRTVAFPFPADWDRSSAREPVTVTSDIAGARPERLLDPENGEPAVDTDQAGAITFTFARAFDLRSVTVRTPGVPGYAPGVQRAANTLRVEASDDGVAFRPVGRLQYPRHGWQTDMLSLTHALPPTTARVFRFVHTPEAAGPYREDEDFAGFERLQLLSLELSSTPRIGLLPPKSGEQWGIAPPTTAVELPDGLCVDPAAIVDLTGRVSPTGALDWTPPPHPHRRWKVLRIGATTTGAKNSAAGGAEGLECDKFNPDAAKMQFDRWFAEALRKVGPGLAGSVLHGLHVDSWEAGSQNWSRRFAEGFERLRGYDLSPWLPVMAGVPLRSADQSERVLFDVRRTISDLMEEAFFGTVSDLAHRQGCIVSAEPANPTFPADGFQHGRHVDLPMGEFWLRTPRNDKPTDVKDAVNTARVYGKRWAAAESFTEGGSGSIGWDETPYTLKALGDRNYAAGLNRLILHVYAAQPWTDGRHDPGETLSGIGTFFSRTQTWWRPGKAWFDYLRRCQALLQQGQAVADLAYFIGENIPARSLLPFQLDPPLPPGYAYDCVNRDALLTLARVEGGRLVLASGASYRVLVLGPQRRVTPELARVVQAFVAAGLTVVAPPWEGSPSAEHGPAADAEVRTISNALARGTTTGAPGGGRVVWGEPARAWLKVAADARFEALDGAPLDIVGWTHRRGPGFEVYFLSNPGDAPLALRAYLRAKGEAQLWLADTGRHTALAGAFEGDHTRVELTLDPRGSAFVVFGAPPLPRAPGRRAPAFEQAVDGDWTIRFADRLTRPKTLRRAALGSWSTEADPDIRFYSGSATYQTRFTFPSDALGRPLEIDLGVVADLAEVRLNGRDLGVAWKPPYRLDVSEALCAGENTLEIVVTNTWRNRLIGDSGKPADQRVTFVVPARRKGEDWLPGAHGESLLPAGLFGPVRIVG